MADLRDFTGKNRKFTGIIGEKISSGTTGERDTSFGGGTLRFNSSSALMEYYNGTEWKSIDAPPSITTFSINGGSPVTSGSLIQSSSNATIAISGSLFDTVNATVLFVGNGGGDVSPLTTVRNNTSLITVTVNTSLFTDANEPYDIKITNGSGLSAILENCITSNAAPAFITASGTLGTIANGARSSYTLSTAAATDPDGDTITYSISAGSLPAGLSLNASTADITGTASAVETNTTSTFTVTASTTGQSTSRQFSITVNAPVVTTYTSGSGTFSVPAGVTAVELLVVAGGGGGGGGASSAGSGNQPSQNGSVPGLTQGGNPGGSHSGTAPHSGAGGGGAGSAGTPTGSSVIQGTGGSGISNAISGSSVFYAGGGGGGGGAPTPTPGGNGGSSVGGDGGRSPNRSGTSPGGDGVANRGGGGGGGAGDSPNWSGSQGGGSGSSGIIVIKY